MSDSENDKRDRLAADRLRALGRHDLISADGTLWFNSSSPPHYWESIGLSLNYQISSAEEMQRPRHDHGIVDFISHLPSKEELRRAKELPPQDPQEIKRHLDELYQAGERVRQERERLAQKPAPTLQEAERLIEAERRQRMAQKSEPTPMPKPEPLTNESEHEESSAEATPDSDVGPDSEGLRWISENAGGIAERELRSIGMYRPKKNPWAGQTLPARSFAVTGWDLRNRPDLKDRSLDWRPGARFSINEWYVLTPDTNTKGFHVLGIEKRMLRAPRVVVVGVLE